MSDQSYPKWIYYYLWFVTCVSTVFAVVAYVNPAGLWSQWEAVGAAGAFSLIGPAGLFIARNLGTAALGAYALLNRSRAMMEAFLVLRFVTDALDGLHAVIGGNPPVIFIGFGTAALELFMLIKLRQYRQQVPA